MGHEGINERPGHPKSVRPWGSPGCPARCRMTFSKSAQTAGHYPWSELLYCTLTWPVGAGKGTLQLCYGTSEPAALAEQAMSPQRYIGLTLSETRVLGEGLGRRDGDCPLAQEEGRPPPGVHKCFGGLGAFAQSFMCPAQDVREMQHVRVFAGRGQAKTPCARLAWEVCS